ncbi:MAG: hypothetical protein J6J23_04180, partial [Clostridia bacterium]|nr:hypothetical protein [Clostridia bacterium]
GDYYKTFKMIEQRYPFFVQNNLMNIVGTHDTSRLANEILSINCEKRIELTKIATLLQYVFIGIPTVFYGDEIGLTNIKDGNSRAPYPWGSENDELLNWYKMLGELRSLRPVISGGITVEIPRDGVVVVKRQQGRESVVAITNLSSESYTIECEKIYSELLTKEKSKGKSFTIEPFCLKVIGKISKTK